MSWSVAWHPVVTQDVRRMSWRAAAEVCRAVVRFAETHEGRVEQTDVRGEIRIVAPGGVALVRIEAASRTLFVRRVLPR